MPKVTNPKEARSYIARVTSRSGPREVQVLPQYWLPGYSPAHKSTPAEAIRFLYDSLVKQSARAAEDAKMAINALEDLKKEGETP